MMIHAQLLPLLSLLFCFVSVSAYPTADRRAQDPQSSLQLDPSQVQKGLEQDGQTAGVETGQVPSATSSNNFINFCLTQQGVPLMNGQQIKTGSCNPTPMGRIVAKDKMPSSKFVFPPNGDKSIKANTAFTIQMAIKNVQAGNFVNPNTNYFAAPQVVNDDGVVVGHTHFVVEAIPDLATTEPTNPSVFAFFKGVNTPADKNGILSVDVDKGLPSGFYRLMSMNAARNHQPILVAVAQHGALDDAVYFTVGAGAEGDAAADQINDNGAAAQASANAAASSSLAAEEATATGAAKGTDTSSAAAAKNTSGANGKGKGSGGNKGKGADNANKGKGADNAKGATDAPPAASSSAATAAPPAASKASSGGGNSLANGQAAQKLNAGFAKLNANSSCKTGEQACVKGGFAQCVNGKFVSTGCGATTQCFALPLVNSEGTSVTCTTPADAQARIAATGATGGVTGGQ